MGSVTSLQCVERLFNSNKCPPHFCLGAEPWRGRRDLLHYIPKTIKVHQHPYSKVLNCAHPSQSAFLLFKTISNYQPQLSSPSSSPCLINLTRPISWRSMWPLLAKTTGRFIWSVCAPREGTMTTEPSLHYPSCIAPLPILHLLDCSPLLPVTSSTRCCFQGRQADCRDRYFLDIHVWRPSSRCRDAECSGWRRHVLWWSVPIHLWHHGICLWEHGM